MTLKIGDVIENAIWLTGEEPEETKEKYKKEVSNTIDDLCETEGFIHGPITMVEKHPMDEDVPPVPKHIQGSKVRLLYLEATVVEKLVILGQSSLVTELDPKDLSKLRKITKEAAAKNGIIITDEQADQMIEELGPDAALENLRTLH